MLSHQTLFAKEIAFIVDKRNALSTLMSASMHCGWSHITALAVLGITFTLQVTRAGEERSWKKL